MARYKMLGKSVLVKPIMEQMTDSGLLLKTDFVPKVLRGEVIALGEHPACSEINVGDVVLFHKFAGQSRLIKDGNDTLRVINMIDIEAVEE